MKIAIKTSIAIPNMPEAVELEGGTLRRLLDVLLRSSYFSKEVVDPKTGELMLDGLFQVHLNGVPCLRLPEGMETPLRDGDTLMLTLILIGGG